MCVIYNRITKNWKKRDTKNIQLLNRSCSIGFSEVITSSNLF